jgi:hypothetical protein
MKNCRKVASLLNTYGVPSAPTMWLLISLQVPERVRRQLQMKSRTVLLNRMSGTPKFWTYGFRNTSRPFAAMNTEDDVSTNRF